MHYVHTSRGRMRLPRARCIKMSESSILVLRDCSGHDLRRNKVTISQMVRCRIRRSVDRRRRAYLMAPVRAITVTAEGCGDELRVYGAIRVEGNGLFERPLSCTATISYHRLMNVRDRTGISNQILQHNVFAILE